MQMKLERVLGIDPGTAITGFGVIEKKGHSLIYQMAGVIRSSPKFSDAERLLKLKSELLELIHLAQPDAVAVEKIFFSTNVKTAMSVAQARGVILLCCAEKGCPIYEYSPSEIKLSVAGYGRADKTQIQKMVKTLLNLKQIPKPDDAADALAVALCYLSQRRIG